MPTRPKSAARTCALIFPRPNASQSRRSLVQFDTEDCGLAVLDGAHGAANCAVELRRAIDPLAVETEGSAELAVVGAVDGDAVPHVGPVRNTVRVMVQVPLLHSTVLAVVEYDDQDRKVVSLGGAQGLNDRVVEERAVADQRRDRPFRRA